MTSASSGDAAAASTSPPRERPDPGESGNPALFLKRAERAGRWLENLLLTTVLAGMIILAAGQVVLRYFGIQGLLWGDEALRLLVLWIAMIGGVAASRDDSHLRIDLLARFLPETQRNLVALTVDIFTAVVTGVIAWYSLQFVMNSREYGDVLLGSMPAWPFQAVLPAGFALIAWRYLVWTARRALLLIRAPSR